MDEGDGDQAVVVVVSLFADVPESPLEELSDPDVPDELLSDEPLFPDEPLEELLSDEPLFPDEL